MVRLYLLLRRVLRRERPLNDELHPKNVVLDRIHSGASLDTVDRTRGRRTVESRLIQLTQALEHLNVARKRVQSR